MKQTSDVPRAYIKEKYLGINLKESYAPRPIPIEKIEARMGKRLFFRMSRSIDSAATSKLLKS